MQEWMTWMEGLGKKGTLVGGEPLQRTGKQVGGRSKVVTDGPFIEAKEMVGGFFLIDVPTREQAVAIARECPAAEWATVEVRETGPCYT